jgi:anti-sigma factor RsiW
MKTLSCAAARRQLEALHDGELPVSDQVAVVAHVDTCAACAVCLADLQMTRLAVRAMAPGRMALTDDATANLQAAVVARMSAEEAASLRTTVREMFEDMHFVYAGLGAAAAVCLCVVITLGMFRTVNGRGPGAVVAFAKMASASVVSQIWGTPGSDGNPVPFGSSVTLPRSIDDGGFASAATDQAEALITFITVINRDGSVATLERLSDSDAPVLTPSSEVERLVANLTGAASKARFLEPASYAGSPVAVNMVWVVAKTTVRGSPESVPDRPTRARRRSAQSFEPDPTRRAERAHA